MNEKEEKITKSFWNMYDEYIKNENKNLRSKLSDLLKEIEKEDKVNQLLRPEKGWNEILAWQVLRDQEFVYNSSVSFLFEGEIIAWDPNNNYDIFLTRIPYAKTATGLILRPGFKLGYENKKNRTDYGWEQMVKKYGITDERGLYLPLYEVQTVEKFCLNLIEEAKKTVLDYLKKEKRILIQQ